jgi:hypothetical protein
VLIDCSRFCTFLLEDDVLHKSIPVKADSCSLLEYMRTGFNITSACEPLCLSTLLDPGKSRKIFGQVRYCFAVKEQ